MAKKVEIPKDKNIIEVPIEEAMPENYLPYAVEVARDRALPDVRDGLKPVHRRILYGAYLLKAFPDKPYFKSARIVGDILGKFHPHGDSSVYDAMVILAQDFSTRMPLIDGQGNWGSIDGDNAAAMRYTEARLTKIALEMLGDIEKGVVEMVPNYSDKELEPSVLPAKYPNLLVNGVFGIAVGLATNIPPHNLGEVIDATLAYIDNNNITTKELMSFIKGPDLPSGGELIGRESLISAYETGVGKVALRAKTTIDTLENGRLGIIISEFPYRKNKAKLLQMVSDMTADKRHAKALEIISDIRDESDRSGIRAVIELKKIADFDKADKVLKYLFKKTELQINLPFNMVAIADGKPETLSLKAVLTHYVNHQKDVITKRTEKELEGARNRFHIVEGFIKAIGIMDQVIKTIRNSTSKQNAKENLMDKFSFTELQSNAILELMLYRLTGLEITAFKKEHVALKKLIADLEKILGSEKELFKVIKKELIEVKKNYSDSRRTIIIDNEEEAKIDLEELIIDEDIVVTLSNEGYIKYVTKKTYNRSNTEISEIEHREGDFNRCVLDSNTRDTIVVFTDIGNMYQLKGITIPQMKWKEKGQRLDEIIKTMDLSKESIVNAFSLPKFNLQKVVQIVTSDGLVKKSSLDKFDSSYTKLMAIKIKNHQKVVDVKIFDRDRSPQVIKVITDKGLQFTAYEPELEEVERNIIGKSFTTLPSKVSIKEIEYTDEFMLKEFSLSLLASNEMKLGSSKKAIKTIKTTSLHDLLLLTERGNVLKLSSAIIQNLENNIKIDDLYHDLKENIVSIVSYNFKTEQEICEKLVFYTGEGYIKKTSLSEFQGEFTSILGHKLKSASDKLVNFDVALDEDNFVMVTERGFVLKSSISGVSEMGRNASGVKGITLKDGDVVVNGKVLLKNSQINVVTKDKVKLEINEGEVQSQNRATRGKALFDLKLGDFIVTMK